MGPSKDLGGVPLQQCVDKAAITEGRCAKGSLTGVRPAGTVSPSDHSREIAQQPAAAIVDSEAAQGEIS